MAHTTIILVRHGETEANIRNVCEEDSPLTENGRLQAKAFAERIKVLPITHIYSSHFTRARDTAGILAEEVSAPHTEEPFLRERDFGTFHGKPDHEIRAAAQSAKDELRWSAKEKQWLDMKLPCNQYETNRTLLARIIPALTTIAEKHMGETIVVVSHGATMRTFLTGIGFAKPFELSLEVENCGFAVVTYESNEFHTIYTEGITKKPHSALSLIRNFLYATYFKLIYFCFPSWYNFFIQTRILSHGGRQPWHVTMLPVEKKPHIVPELKAAGFEDNTMAWIDHGEEYSLRLRDPHKFDWQYHFRIFEDGEVRAHYELTPEEHHIDHLREVGLTARYHVFSTFLMFSEKGFFSRGKNSKKDL